MKRNKRKVLSFRWIVYIFMGAIWAIANYHFREIMQSAGNPILDWGIWVLPLILIVIYEVSVSHSKLLGALVGAVFWETAIIVYYCYYDFLYNGDSLWQIGNWSFYAVIGGAIIGFFVAMVFQLIHHVKINNK